ncbi:uncharacterized protein N7515_006106 [Penicillium bovifimosum]|uniref:Uncharacterized protein n=1 Tax=Penicillium bovifimosum TaxID=126998 RepID=A0A9W9L0V4_9EURO|nr:uncharacterized protein N7515_006106 [Penicillium bovifimosum]KAJ5130067.1 hypothetical protein N7515_006106 [Penicillium bovifimosum]
MSTTTTSMSPSSTACGGSVWQIPTTDAACAVVVSGNMTEVMDTCCKTKPTKYDNDCGIYCLAQGQDVNKLQSCLTSKSGNYHDVFCNAALNATATATSTASRTSSGTGTGTGTATESAATSTSTDNAAVGKSVSKSGLGLVALLFGSAFMAML